MGARVALLMMAAAAGCSGGGTDLGPIDAQAIPTPFELDVVMYPEWDYFLVWQRSEIPPPCEPAQRFPRPGECEIYVDGFGCTTRPEWCSPRVAIERNGVVLGETSGWTPGGWGARAPQLGAGAEAELVIDGCGGTFRMPVSTQAPSPPMPIDVYVDDSYLKGTITSDDPSLAIYAEASFGLGAYACTQPSTTFRAGRLPPVTRSFDLRLASLKGGLPVATPWGELWIWNAKTLSLGSWLSPVRAELDPSLWGLGTITADVSMIVDGEVQVAPPTYLHWGFRDGADGPLLRLDNGFDSFRYEAGDAVDTVQVLLAEGIYRGTVPHVTPSDVLELSLADNGHVALSIGPVTVANINGLGVTHVVSFELSWDHTRVVRPAP